VKIADFGVSNKLQKTLGLAETFTGTVTYMDPGRIMGQPHSSNADIWSLGLTIMECALGYYPYIPPGHNKDVTFFELQNYIVENPAPSLPSDKFSSEFCSFISSCLCKNVTKRPFAADLLDHPFLQKYVSETTDSLASWLTSGVF